MPAPPPFAPTDIPGMLAWWDPSATYVTLSGSDVTTWTSREGNAYALAQSNASLRPSWSSSTILGKPGLQMTGGKYVFAAIALAGLMDVNARWTSYCVVRMPGFANNCVWSMSNMVSNFFSFGRNNSRFPIFNQRTSSIISALGTASVPLGPAYLGGFLPQSTTFTFRSNGTTSSPSFFPTTPTATNVFVGARANGSVIDEFFEGDIGDLLFYDHVLTSPEIAELEAWIVAKYPGI